MTIIRLRLAKSQMQWVTFKIENTSIANQTLSGICASSGIVFKVKAMIDITIAIKIKMEMAWAKRDDRASSKSKYVFHCNLWYVVCNASGIAGSATTARSCHWDDCDLALKNLPFGSNAFLKDRFEPGLGISDAFPSTMAYASWNVYQITCVHSCKY